MDDVPVPLWREAAARSAARPPPATSELVARARAAVVHVRGRVTGRAGGLRSGRLSVGTGFFVHPRGFLITNAHVVEDVDDLRVRLFDGRELAACVAGDDGPTDIALLRVSVKDPVTVLPLGDSGVVRVGEPALVVGNPFGFDYSVTAGIVSATDRVIDRASLGHSEAAAYAFFIQTDAAINLGNSGGPLLDQHGAVVGVASAFWGGAQPAQGIGFAIPIEVVKRLLPRLALYGAAPRSYLGLEGQPLDPALATAFGFPSARGALVAAVESGSAAALAGIEPGDVVTMWNGEPLAGVEDLKIYAELTPPETRVRVRLVRGGETAERSLTTRPGPNRPRPLHPSACGGRRDVAPESSAVDLGLEVKAVPRRQAENLPGGKGVVVQKVSGGAARAAGIIPGDILLRVGSRAAATPAEFLRILNMGTPGQALPVLVRREGHDFWVAMPRR